MPNISLSCLQYWNQNLTLSLGTVSSIRLQFCKSLYARISLSYPLSFIFTSAIWDKETAFYLRYHFPGVQKQNKRIYNQAFLEDPRPLEENELDDIAEQISRSWRHVGRKLNITESSLNEIDLRTGQNTEREKAFQMLLEWRERFPDDFTRGRLFTVLDLCNLKYTAKRFFEVTSISRSLTIEVSFRPCSDGTFPLRSETKWSRSIGQNWRNRYN